MPAAEVIIITMLYIHCASQALHLIPHVALAPVVFVRKTAETTCAKACYAHCDSCLAYLTSERANISDPRARELAETIIQTQRQ